MGATFTFEPSPDGAAVKLTIDNGFGHRLSARVMLADAVDTARRLVRLEAKPKDERNAAPLPERKIRARLPTQIGLDHVGLGRVLGIGPARAAIVAVLYEASPSCLTYSEIVRRSGSAGMPETVVTHMTFLRQRFGSEFARTTQGVGYTMQKHGRDIVAAALAELEETR